MFAPIETIMADLRAGKMIVLTDDENRENEGDLVLPAQFVTAESVTFMLQNALGYMCLSLTEADCDRLNLHPQGSINTSQRGTAFTVSIDLHPKFGGTTGVSARERAKCIQMAIDPKYSPDDFVRPGHINPLRSRDGGVLVRTGQTEGSLDLCRLAGLVPAAVIIEIMKPDGEMARGPDLIRFCEKHGLKMCSVAQIIEHRLGRESLVKRIGPEGGTLIHTEFGDFRAIPFKSLVDPLPHLALTCGDVGASGRGGEASGTLVRMHRRHLLGDVFGDVESSREGATGATLRAAMKLIQEEGRGAIVYLRTSYGEGKDLESLLHSASRGGEKGSDSPEFSSTATPMPNRELGIGCQILRALGITRLRLVTNHARPLPGLEAFGLEVAEIVPMQPGAAKSHGQSESAGEDPHVGIRGKSG